MLDERRKRIRLQEFKHSAHYTQRLDILGLCSLHLATWRNYSSEMGLGFDVSNRN